MQLTIITVFSAKSNSINFSLEGVGMEGVSLHSFGCLMVAVVVCGRGLAMKDAYKIALKIKVIQNRVLLWYRQLYTIFDSYESFINWHIMYDHA